MGTVQYEELEQAQFNGEGSEPVDNRMSRTSAESCPGRQAENHIRTNFRTKFRDLSLRSHVGTVTLSTVSNRHTHVELRDPEARSRVPERLHPFTLIVVRPCAGL